MAAIRGFKEAVKNISNFDKKTVARLVIAVQATQAVVVNTARQTVPVASTDLLRSILPGRVLISSRRITGEVDARIEYASFVEFGTRPHFPPIEPLKIWAGKVLGDEGAAWAIAKKIAERGTRPQPFLGPAVLGAQSSFRRLVKRAMRP